MEVQYVTNNPILFTIGAINIFCFTSSVIRLYDSTVVRRQRKLLSTALRTNAIVSPLFPSVVRDRIYPTDQSIAGQKQFKVANTKARLKSFLNDGTSNSASTDASKDNPSTSTPVADLFSAYVNCVHKNVTGLTFRILS
jgi:hypothetical protein